METTVVHLYVSTVRLPAHLKDTDLEYEFFFNLFHVLTLINVARDRLGQRREVPRRDSWDAREESDFVLIGHTKGATTVAFSPCGYWIATGGYYKAIRLRDVA